MYRFIALIALTHVLSIHPVSSVFAVDAPQFPSCVNPNGSLISDNGTGPHGIAGDTGSFDGRDTVYLVNDGVVSQCFCSADGKGIQTNWWLASSLTEEQIAILKSEGWTYVPDGNLWGLTNDPYITKNTSYSCLPPGGGGNPNGGGDGKSDGGSSCPECTAPPIGGSVLGDSTGEVLGTSTGDVLGLAATGDSWILYTVFIAAAFLFYSGVKKLNRS